MSRAAIPLQLAGDAGDVDAAVSVTRFIIRRTKKGDDSLTFEAVGIDTQGAVVES